MVLHMETVALTDLGPTAAAVVGPVLSMTAQTSRPSNGPGAGSQDPRGRHGP